MYQIKIKERAQKDMRKLPPSIKERVVNLIRSLAEEPRPAGAKKLTAKQEWRLRQGDYRILYAVDDEQKTVIVVRVKHRREVYR